MHVNPPRGCTEPLGCGTTPEKLRGRLWSGGRTSRRPLTKAGREAGAELSGREVNREAQTQIPCRYRAAETFWRWLLFGKADAAEVSHRGDDSKRGRWAQVMFTLGTVIVCGSQDERLEA